MRRRAGLALAVFALTGCAALSPAPTPAPVPASTAEANRSDIPVPSVTRPAPVPRRPAAAATLDSLPSRDALEVLASIPDPIAGSTPAAAPVRAPAPSPPPSQAPVPVAASEVPALRDSVTEPVLAIDHGVPVPAQTRPMGDDPDAPPVTLPPLPPPEAAPDSAAATRTPPQPPATAPVAPASADAEWRVQVGAPAEADKAENTRRGAESILLLPFVTEREGGLHKVRTKDRLTREAAERLRQRAVDSGFAGSFLLRQPESR